MNQDDQNLTVQPRIIIESRATTRFPTIFKLILICMVLYIGSLIIYTIYLVLTGFVYLVGIISIVRFGYLFVIKEDRSLYERGTHFYTIGLAWIAQILLKSSLSTSFDAPTHSYSVPGSPIVDSMDEVPSNSRINPMPLRLIPLRSKKQVL
jgi:hypothetical protein